MTANPYNLYLSADRHTSPSVALQQTWAWALRQNEPLLSVAFDTETTSATWGIPQSYGGIVAQHPIVFGISACVPGPDRLHLLWGRLGTPMFGWMVSQLGRPGHKVAHNARFDVRVCRSQGILVAASVDDTLTMARIIWDRKKKFDLQTLAEMICPEVSDWVTPIRKELTRLRREFKNAGAKRLPDYSDVPDKIMGPYSMTDSFLCWLLNARLRPAIDKDFSELYAREVRVLNLIANVEDVGVPFDADQAEKESAILGARVNRLKLILKGQSGLPNFKPNAPAHVLRACKALGAPMASLVKDGVPSTGVKLLEGLLDTKGDSLSPRLRVFLKNLLTYRAMSKIVGTYLKPLAKRSRLGGGRIYCSVNPTNTRTNRMSSSGPNFQNIPRAKEPGEPGYAVKRCVVAPDGWEFWYFDFEAMEFVVFGLLANVKTILDAYATGEDLHGAMARIVIGPDYTPEDRQRIKTLDFMLLYGGGIRKLALGMDVSLDRAKEIKELYDSKFPDIRNFMRQCKRDLQRRGYVEDYFGKRYHIEHGAEYKGANALDQGGCASAFKIALLNIADADLITPICQVMLPVHDEVIFLRKRTDTVREHQFVARVKRCMTDIPQFTSRGLTLRVDVKRSRTSWAEKAEWPEKETT
jgi:DNA polymerase I